MEDFEEKTQEHESVIIIVVLRHSGRIIMKIDLFCMLERTFMIELLKKVYYWRVSSLGLSISCTKLISYDEALLYKIA